MFYHKEVNEVIQDHRVLIDWSEVEKNVTTGNATELSIDMKFNDGHHLSIICYIVLMIVSSIGNLTVLYLLTKRRMRGPSKIDIMLTHLAIADLLVTFLLMPMEIGWAYTVTWNAGDFMCRMMSFFRTFGLYLSSFVLVCISIDRYYAVLKPLKLKTSDTRGKTMLLSAWVSSFMLSIPQAVIFHVESHPEVEWFQQCVTFNSFPDEFYTVLYSIIGMLAMYAIPLIAIIFCYISIYVEIYRKSQKVVEGTDSFRRSNDDVLSRAKQRTLKMTLTIVAVFVICWTPFYVMSLWYWIDRDSAILIDQRIQKGLFIFASTNSCMNPIVYGIFNIRGRDHNNCNNGNSNRNASISRRVEALTGPTRRHNSYVNGTPRMDSSNSITIGILQSKTLIEKDSRPRSSSTIIKKSTYPFTKSPTNGNNFGNNHSDSRKSVNSRSVSIDESQL